jgi:hypothetical protein
MQPGPCSTVRLMLDRKGWIFAVPLWSGVALVAAPGCGRSAIDECARLYTADCQRLIDCHQVSPGYPTDPAGCDPVGREVCASYFEALCPDEKKTVVLTRDLGDCIEAEERLGDSCHDEGSLELLRNDCSSSLFVCQ